MDKTPVIKIRPGIEVMPMEKYEPPELKIAVAENKGEYCSHEYVKIFEYHRLLACSQCGATLDAFDYILQVGKSERLQLSNVKYYKRETKDLLEEIEKLKEEKSRLRAVVNKLKKNEQPS